MWAYSVVAPGRFERLEVPAPDPSVLAAGQVVLRMLAGGICGSDLGGFAGHQVPSRVDRGPYAPNAPGYPLHEVVGTVLDSAAPHLEVGSRVVGWGANLASLSEFALAAGDEIVAIGPEWNSNTAVLLQPLACVLYAVDQVRDVAGLDVAVIGQGPTGILFSHVLKSRGAGHVTGVDLADRAAEAPLFGVDLTVHAASERWAAHLPDSRRPGLVVDAVGHQSGTLRDAVLAAAPGAQIYYFGVPDHHPYPFDLLAFFRKSLTLVAGTTRNRAHYLREAVAYAGEHPDLLTNYITHTFDVADVQQAFETASRPAPGRLKVTLRMT